MNITYREAEPSDAGKFLEYSKIVGSETDNLTFGAEGLSLTISQEADFIRKFAGNPGSIMIVAFDEGELIGTGAVSVVSGKPRFAHRREIAISVRKDYWGKGIGTKVLTLLMDYYRSFGENRFLIETWSGNHKMLGCARKLGFYEVKRIKGAHIVDGTEVDDLVLEKIF